MLAHTLGAGITLRIAADPDLPPLLADKGQLETVLVNLAVNARDAMPGGGALLLAAAPETVLDAQAHPAGLAPGGYLRLSVADTGTGMAPPCWRGRASRFSPPSRTARAPGWVWPWRAASPTSPAAASGSRARLARARP